MGVASLREEHKRSVLKAVSWRIIATLVTMVLVYIVTGKLELLASVGVFDVELKMGLYFLHERGWNSINFGKSIGGTVESAMRSPPVTILALESVRTLIHKMIDCNIGAVIVSKDQKPLGLVTERDVLERLSLYDKTPDRTYVKDIMTSPLQTIDYRESLMKALTIMLDKQIRRLVVTRKEKAIGIITERRILEALIRRGK